MHTRTYTHRTVLRHQKGELFWIVLKQEMMGWQCHQLDHVQIICTLLQTDNHTNSSPFSYLQTGCPSCHPTICSKHWRTKV